MSPFTLVLASLSTRRADLLRTIGVEPAIVTPRVPEEAIDGESPGDHVLRLAEAKGRSVADRLRSGGERGGAVLAADTAVVIEGTVLGKPRDPEHAVEMLRSLSGREHDVLTGAFLVRTDDGRSASVVDATRVRFRRLPSRWIEWYVRTGEPMDKAGGYGIQGLGALLTDGVDGSWSNVVGLPLERLPDLFRSVGLDLLDFMDADGGRC